MRKPSVFYSFHFDNDVFRVQQIRNIGALEGNEPVSKNDWETLRRTPKGIENWIDNNLKYKSYVIVLIGAETSNRRWVDYEIRNGWDDGKKLLGIYIHNLKDPRTSNSPPFYGKSPKGANPFQSISLKNGNNLSSFIPCFDPSPNDAYKSIVTNLEQWMSQAGSRNA